MGLASTVALTAFLAADPPVARAASKRTSARTISYPLEQVWATSVRYLRIDRGYEILDRDLEAGYVLFGFESGAAPARGSIEAFATKDASGRSSARVVLSLDGGPVHLPHTLLEGISAKLRRERGQPAPPPPRKPAPPPKKPEPPKDEPPSERDPDPPGKNWKRDRTAPRLFR